MIGLDVTHPALLGPEVERRLALTTQRAHVAVDLDVHGFFELLVERIASLG
jgi:hypothetical protein